MSTKLQTVSHLDLVWDTYFADSLKGSTRAKRGQGVRRHVVADPAISGNWLNFLRVDSNKTELFRFLSAALMEWFDQEDKQLVITDGEAVLSKPLLPDLISLAPCNHVAACISWTDSTDSPDCLQILLSISVFSLYSSCSPLLVVSAL